MAVSITDGNGLEFDASISMDLFINQQKQLLDGIKEAGQASIETTKKQQEAVKAATDAMKAAGEKAAAEIAKPYQAQTEAIKATFDKSKKDAEEYFATISAYSKEGVNTALNQSASKSTFSVSNKPSSADSFDNVQDRNLKQVLLDAQAEFKLLDEQTQIYLTAIASLQQRMEEIKIDQNELNEGLDKGAISTNQFYAATTSLVAQQKMLSSTMDILTNQQKEYDAIYSRADGATNQKIAILKQLEHQYDEMGEAEKNSVVGKELRQNIIDLKGEIKTLKSDTIDQTTEKALQLTTELRKIKNELATTSPSSAGYEQLLEKAAELEKRLKNVNAEVKLAGSNTAGIGAATQAIRGVIAGYTTLQGVMGLLNKDDKELQKTLTTVTSAMAVLNGVQEISALVTKESALNTYLLSQYKKLTTVATTEQVVATEGLAVAEGVQAAATESAAIAQTSLNVAMAANPAGILLLALTAIVAAIQLFSSDTDTAIETQLQMNEALAETNQIIIELSQLYNQFYSNATRSAEDALSLAQAQGKSEKELINLKQKALEAKRLENVALLSELGYTGDITNDVRKQLKYKETEVIMAKEQIQALLYVKEITGKLSDSEEERLKNLQAIFKSLNDGYVAAKAAFDNVQSSNAEISNTEAERVKKNRDDRIKSESAAADARLSLAKKNTAEELNAELAAIETRRKAELSNVNLTAGEIAKINAQAQKDEEDARRKFRILQLNDQKYLIQRDLANVKEGSTEELKLKIDNLRKELQIELEQEGITAARKKELKANAAKEIRDITLKYDQDITETDINKRIADIDTELSVVEKGSQEELKLKQDLIDQKAALDILSAARQIKNETLLVSKIRSIYAKAAVDKRKQDDDFADKSVKNRLKTIENETNKSNQPLDKILSSPVSTFNEKFHAELNKLKNNLSKLQQQKAVIDAQINEGKGNVQDLTEQSQALDTAISNANNAIDNLEVKHIVDQYNKLSDAIGSIGSKFSSIADGISDTNPELAEMLQSFSDIANVASQAATAAAAFAGGDIVGGIAGTLGVIGSVLGLGKKAREERRKYQEEVMSFQTAIYTGEQEINLLYRERYRGQVMINKLRLEGLEDEKELLKQQIKDNAKQAESVFSELQKLSGKKLVISAIPGMNNRIEDLMKKQGLTLEQVQEKYSSLFNKNFKAFSLAGQTFEQLEDLYIKGQLEGKSKELFETLQKIKQEGVDINKLLEENANAAREAFTGTTSDSITDSIVEGFRNGRRAAGDFADDFQLLMQDALLQSIKFKTLEGPLKEFYNQFAQDSESDGVLTESEIDTLKATYDEIIGNAAKEFDQLQKVANLSLSDSSGNSNSLSGAIKGITADQADLLAGQFGGLRTTAADSLNVLINNLKSLQNIEYNTSYILAMARDIKELKDFGIKIKG